MIEIFESNKEQFGISTFNRTLSDIFDRDGLDSMINYSDYSVSGDGGTFIYSSQNEMYPTVISLKGKHIFVVHGLNNPNFLPPKDFDFNAIVCFSKKAFRHLIKNGFKNVRQCPQIVDDSFWNSNHRGSGHILVIDPRNYGFYISQVHNSIKDHRFLKVRCICKMWTPEELREEIEEASVVIAYGRSAMEAILCKKPTIIMGHNGGDGLVTPENIEKMMESNMSGYSMKEPIDLTKEISMAFDLKLKDIINLRSSMIDHVGSSLATSEMYIQ